MKAWPIDPLDAESLSLEASEKLQEGKLACGSQAFIGTLLQDFDPSMSALPIIAKAEFAKCWIVHRLIGNVCWVNTIGASQPPKNDQLKISSNNFLKFKIL